MKFLGKNLPNWINIIRFVKINYNIHENLLFMTFAEKCNKILSEFNPVFKERKETEQRFSKLETSVEDIKTMISNLTNTINTNNNGQV